MVHRTFSSVKSLPWSLCCGDIRANLRALAAGTEPTEPTSLKIYRLARESLVSERELVKGLELLATCPWTARVVEQLHGSVAALHKYRPEMQMRALLGRS
eukprot:6468364-Amphidinium_carterae.1